MAYCYSHDVFVSFRGRDVRYKFADHLFAALRRNNVKAFRDCSDLRRGVIIEEGIQQAIERSRLYVVILTQNYASSHWCLDELVKVMKCSNHGKKGIVFPIFYHVSPADLFGCYIDDFDHHMIKYSYERVNNWIQALNCIVEISGWEVTDNHPEASLVENIARTLRRRLWMSTKIRKAGRTITILNYLSALARASPKNHLQKIVPVMA